MAILQTVRVGRVPPWASLGYHSNLERVFRSVILLLAVAVPYSRATDQ